MKRRCCCKNFCYRAYGENDIFFSDISDIAKSKPTVVIDVRSKQEYNEKHFEGAINIPLLDIRRAVPSIVQNYNTYIIVYCSTGLRSKRAQETLQRMGYKNVYNVIEEFF